MWELRLLLKVEEAVGVRASSREPKPGQDSAGLVRREVSSIEAGRAGDDLLRRIPTAAHDDVVLLDRLRQHPLDGSLDGVGLELDTMACDLELRHILRSVLTGSYQAPEWQRVGGHGKIQP
jgi:hypothetical protein